MSDIDPSDNLRGSTPVYTAKDVLLGLDRKVGDMDLKLSGVNTAIQIFVSQNLNARLVSIEASSASTVRDAGTAFRLAQDHETKLQQLIGAQMTLRVVFGSILLTSCATIVALLKAFGAF